MQIVLALHPVSFHCSWSFTNFSREWVDPPIVSGCSLFRLVMDVLDLFDIGRDEWSDREDQI